jgi:omega-amidase
VIQNIKICIIQADIIWQNSPANIKKFSRMIDSAGHVDIIILPEMFTTGFSMQPENLKESMDGESVSWMKKTAKENDACITGSIIIEEDGNIYNRCIWVFPEGKIEYYDKRHLFTMSGEQMHYSPGNRKLLVEYKGWRFFPLICYDLRFPAWSRNTQNYDLLLYMANWPAPRHYVWKKLLPARAIENQSYCIGVNRVGEDGYGLNYLGDSALIDPKGDCTFLGDKEMIKIFQISYSELHDFRREFPVLEDRDEFKIL